MPSKPKVYLMIPPPLYLEVFTMYQIVINYWLPIAIREIAFELGL